MHTGRESPHHSRRDAKPPGAIGGLRLRVSASRVGWAVAELFLPDGYGFVQHCAKPNNEPFGDDSNYPSIVILGMIYWVGPALTDLNGKQTPGIVLLSWQLCGNTTHFSARQKRQVKRLQQLAALVQAGLGW